MKSTFVLKYGFIFEKVSKHDNFSDFMVELGGDQTVTIGANSAHTVTWVIRATRRHFHYSRYKA